MQYKTIVLELLQQRPEMHEQLRRTRKLLPTMETYAKELKTSHEAWKETLSQARPGSDPSQIASEAMEMALKELEDRLPSASPSGRERSRFHKSKNHRPIASGEKTKARDILAAIRTLKTIEQEQRPATPEEKQTLARFAGFGPVALSIFPRSRSPAATRTPAGRHLGEELKTLLYARRNTTAPNAPPSTPSTRRRPSSRPSTRPSPAWASPATPRSWNPAAAPAIS